MTEKSHGPKLKLPSILLHTAGPVRTVIEGFDTDIFNWQPSAERWSAAMVIVHLAESEVNCFRLRLRRTALEDSPVLEPYDQWAPFRAGSTVSAYDALRDFKVEREKTLVFLRSLPADVIARQCQHQKLGRL